MSVREYLDSRSSFPPQTLVEANSVLDLALEAAIAEYARLGLTPAEISETMAEAMFQAWFYLPEDPA